MLVVEDDADTRFAYRALLERAGWEVVEAGDGEEALRQARERPPRVMVVDISMPGIDGWETTRRIKEEPATRNVAVLAVTGHGLDEDREQAHRVGCDGYLVKPLRPGELTIEVERLAGPPAADPPSTQ